MKTKRGWDAKFMKGQIYYFQDNQVLTKGSTIKNARISDNRTFLILKKSSVVYIFC